MGKDLIIEVRVKWDDLMSSANAENTIKRKVVDEVVKRIVEELPIPEIDFSDLKELVKARIVKRKVDEVLGS